LAGFAAAILDSLLEVIMSRLSGKTAGSTFPHSSRQNRLRRDRAQQRRDFFRPRLESLERRDLLTVLLPGYQESVYAANLQMAPASMTIDQATGDLYYADDDNLQGLLRRLQPDGTFTVVTTDFTPLTGTFSSTATDIQFQGAFVYTLLSNGGLVQINAATGQALQRAQFMNFGIDAGLAAVGNLLYINDGAGTAGQLRSVDTANNFSSVVVINGLQAGARGLEAGPGGKLFLTVTGTGAGLYGVNLVGAQTFLVSQAPIGVGNFAIDPSGNYAFARSGNTVVRIDLVSGAATTFLTDLLTDSTYDLTFGPSSSGVGQSLFVGDTNRIVEVSGFGAPNASIQGTKWEDLDRDGVRDGGEPAMAGATIYLDLNANGVRDESGGQLEPAAMTDASGNYSFSGLTPGEYIVRELPVPSVEQTYPVRDARYHNAYIYLAPGASNMQLARIDADTGQVTRIGSPSTTRLHGLVRTNSGQLFGINLFNAGFYEVNSTTGALSLRGTSPLPLAGGLAYDALTDTIYGAVLDSNNIVKLASFNRLTGMPTAIGPGIPFVFLSGTSGLAFDPNRRVVVAFDNIDKQFYEFDLSGNVRLLWGTPLGANEWGFSFDGTNYLLHRIDLDRRAFYVLDPYKQQIVGSFLASEPVPMEALDTEFVSQAHRVVLRDFQAVTGLDFGNFVLNQPPLADAGGPYTIDEGIGLALDASASSDPDNDPLTFAWDLDNDGQFDDAAGSAPTISAADLAALGVGDDGTYTIHVQVIDDDGATDTADTTLEVRNAAPTITSVENPYGVVGAVSEGNSLTLSGLFSDAGRLDTHLVTIAWGDGQSSLAEVSESSGSGSFVASHAYAAGGPYEVLITVADDDNGSATASTSVLVSGTRVQDGTLHIIGTSGADRAAVKLDEGVLVIDASFIPTTRTAQPADVLRVAALLGDGDDRFAILGSFHLPAVVSGGNGNDRIYGSQGRSVLIGGAGEDFLAGGSDQDLMIGGYTDFDANAQALHSLLLEWTSARTFAERVANVTDGSGTEVRANGNYFLTLGPTGTVHHDGAIDKIHGYQDLDWFFAAEGEDQFDQRPEDLIDAEIAELFG
jgi:hypothetical protein